MSDDRQLLEMATKAAGMRLNDAHIWHDGAGQWVRWNPLTDDGDALRLAVKLGMGIVVCELVHKSAANVGEGEYFEVPHNANPYAATRRAIVRAAASLGGADA